MRKLAAILLFANTSISAQQSLPPGPGAEVFRSRCVICHEGDIITSQKLTATGWSRSIDKMVRWGSQITPEERKILEPYLAMHFAPRPAVSHNSTEAAKAPALSAGEGTYKRACLVCHDADIIEQQKLTAIGWTRSVEKMMRWGATVSEADKAGLIDYLYVRFPPR